MVQCLKRWQLRNLLRGFSCLRTARDDYDRRIVTACSMLWNILSSWRTRYFVKGWTSFLVQKEKGHWNVVSLAMSSKARLSPNDSPTPPTAHTYCFTFQLVFFYGTIENEEMPSPPPYFKLVCIRILTRSSPLCICYCWTNEILLDWIGFNHTFPTAATAVSTTSSVLCILFVDEMVLQIHL